MKSIFWKLFLAEGWYFIEIEGDWDFTAKPAYWNGYVWENRTAVIPDERVRCVVGRVPNKKTGNNSGNKFMLPSYARYALAGLAGFKSRITRATRSSGTAHKAL